MNDLTSVYLLVATNTASAFGMFSGNPFGDGFDEEKSKVAKGFALGWSFGIALAASASVKNATPLAWWAGVSIFFIGLYEVASERRWSDGY